MLVITFLPTKTRRSWPTLRMRGEFLLYSTNPKLSFDDLMTEHQAMHGRAHESGCGHAYTGQSESNLREEGGYSGVVQNLLFNI